MTPTRLRRLSLTAVAMVAAIGLAGCENGMPLGGGGYTGGMKGAPQPAPRTAASVQTTATADMGAATPVAATDSGAAAAVAAGAKGSLGTTVASLGAAGQGGLWLKTPLVKAKTNGRIVNTETGKSANVTLMPLAGGGSGSQASIGALQAVGAGLTDLPTLEVFAV